MVRRFHSPAGGYVRFVYAGLCLAFACLLTNSAHAQTATYRLHKEASSTAGQFQLKTANPDGTSLAIQTADLRAAATGEKLIKAFDTQAGVPNAAGTIPSGSTVTFSLWMKKTANFGTMFPQAKLLLNSAAGTSLCTATGTTALTTTLAKYTFTCTTSAGVAVASANRFYVWVGVNLTAGNSTNSFRGELDVEGTANGNYDSLVTVPLPSTPPAITSLAPTSGPRGSAVTINGSNFGATQGSSTVKFNGTTAAPTSWSATSISAPVPAGATTGSVVVAVGGLNSNGVAFTVTNSPPAVSVTSPSNNASFAAGSNVTINASASDADGSVTKVEFFQGATKLGEDLSSPYTFTWNSVAAGSYALTARATDNATAVTTSTAINITVFVPNALPAVSITGPAGGASFLAPANITVAAAASDSDGTVSKVEFFQNSTLLGQDTAPPYSLTWNNVAAGNYALTAKATDNAGGVTTSSAVNITVQAPSISGRVTAAVGGAAVAGATVKAHQGDTIVGTAAADAAGNFMFAGLAPGTYVVEVTADGYKRQARPGVTVTAGAASTADFSLEAEAGSITYGYDGLGRLVSVVDPAKGAVTYTYDEVGNLLSLTRHDPNQVFVSHFTPTRASVGATVSIYGMGFSATPSQNAVQFNGTAAAIVSATATQIVTSVPAGATTGPLTVTTPAGTVTGHVPFTVMGTSSIDGFSPRVGIAGTAVVITGSGFATAHPGNVVKFNLASASVSASTTTSINTSVPVGATSGKLSVVNQSGTFVSAEDFFIPPHPYGVNDVDEAALGRLAIGGSRTITVNPGDTGKIAMTIFDGVAGQRVNLSLGGSGLPNSRVTVYSPGGAVMITGHVSGAGGLFDVPTLGVSGTYTVVVAPQASGTGNLTLSLNAIAPTTVVSLGSLPVTTALAFAGQTARLGFNGSAGQHIVLTGSGSTINVGTVTLHKPDGVEFLSAALGTSVWSLDHPILPADGTYVVSVSSAQNYTGSVTFSVSEVADLTASITPGGAAVPLDFTDLLKNGRVTFGAVAGDHVRVNINSVTALPSVVTVYSPNWTPVHEPLEVNTSGGGAYIDVPFILSTGTYTIHTDPQGSTGGIEFSLTQTRNVFGTVALDGPPANINIANPGENAQFTFNAGAGQRVRVSLGGVTVPSSTVTVKDPGGATLASSPMDARGALIDIAALPSSGTYTVQILIGAGGTGGMNLSVSSVAANASIPLALNGPYVTTAVTAAGQTPQLTFAGAAGQRINYGMLEGATLAGSLVVNNPDGTTLETIPLGKPFFRTLFVSGTYTATVTPTSGSTGSVTFMFTNTAPNVGNPLAPGAERSAGGAVGEKVWLSFDGVAGGKASFKAYYPSAYTYFTASVYAPDGTLLIPPAVIGDASFSTFIDGFTLPVTGRYLILLEPGEGYAVTVRITLYDATDSVGTMTPGGPPVSVVAAGVVTINSGPTRPGQNARRTFNGTAGQRLSLTGNKTSTYGDAFISLLGPDGSTLGTPFYLGSQGCCSSISNGSLQTPPLPADGVYTVLVDPDRASGITVTLTLSIQPPDKTGSLTIGGPPFPLSIDAAGQNAYLTFSAAAGQHVKLDLGGVTIPSSMVTILRPDGTPLGNHPNGASIGVASVGTGGATLDVPRLPVAGTYTIFVDPASTHTGAMNLTLSAVGDTSSSLTVGGASVPVNITTARQNALVTFSATLGQHLKLTLGGVTIPSSYVYIYKPDGSLLVNRDGYSTVTHVDPAGNVIVIPYAPAAGTYTVFIDPMNDDVGGMNLTLVAVADQPKTATVGGAAVPASVTTAGQNVRLTFTGTAGQHLSLRLSSVTVPSSTIHVYRPDGAAVGPPLSVGTSGGFFDIPIAPATGTYTVIADLLEGTGNMSFTLSSISDVTGNVVAGGAPLSINVATARQNARPTFSGTAGQRVSLNLTGVTITASLVSIIKPDGTTLVEPFNVGTNGQFVENILLPATGTYTILVNPDSTRTGVMTLTLYNTPEITGVITAGGASVPLAVNSPGQVARLSLSGTANQRVTVLVGNSPSTLVVVDLIAPDGRVIISQAGYGNVQLPVQTLPANGTYTIVIDLYQMGTGNLTATVTTP